LAKQSSGKYEKILQAAIEVISEKGLDKASISEIVVPWAVPAFLTISEMDALSNPFSEMTSIAACRIFS
jgi:hypothetical protein